ncbi:MAG: ABC transporter ATP-binding protein [Lachnospiraceae bacterium]|nr:ABC transporter ATP-binding protein [Lachnospiraceae bacterium]
MEPIIKVEGLKKYFGEIKAVNGIDFQVEKGELFGFLGVNGAGKSTTINMLCTVFKPTAGNVEICGLKVGKDDEEIRRRIGVVYQNNCLDERLTVKENLFIRGALYEKNSRHLTENIFRICEILELEDVYNRRFSKLSGGQKRRCEIARALVNTPEIMFLDEPTTGLDPATRKAVWKSIDRLRKEEKMTVFLTTHYMEEAARASHIAIIDGGKIKEYGTPFSLKEVYAKDKLKLWPKPEGEMAKQEENGKILEQKLRTMELAFKRKEEYLIVEIPDSMAALPILDAVSDIIGGFEVVQGSMDDVFLNVTGKKLEA